jgi:NADH:ubiquinone oxidoreductase subunit E
LHPVLKQEIMMSGTGFLAVAAREADAKARKEERKEAQKEIDSLKIATKKALELKTRLTIMHGWHRGAPLDLIADMADTSQNEVRQLIARFEKVKNYCQTHPEPDIKILTQLSGLNEAELKKMLTLLAG